MKQTAFNTPEDFAEFYKINDYMPPEFYDERNAIARTIVLINLHKQKYGNKFNFSDIFENVTEIIGKSSEYMRKDEKTFLIYLTALNQTIENMVCNYYPNTDPGYIDSLKTVISEFKKYFKF